MKTGSSIPNPIMRFEDGGFPDYVMKEIHKAGFALFSPRGLPLPCLDWAGHGWDCPDWIWEDFGLPASWHHAVQPAALPGERRRSHRVGSGPYQVGVGFGTSSVMFFTC